MSQYLQFIYIQRFVSNLNADGFTGWSNGLLAIH